MSQSAVPPAFAAPTTSSDAARETPPESGTRKLGRAIAQALVHFFATLCLVQCFAALGTLADYYSEHVPDLELPRASQSVFFAVLMHTRYWYLLVAAAVFVNPLVALALQYLPPNARWIRVVWFQGYLLLVVALMAIGTAGMILPLRAWMEAAATR